MPPDPPRSLHLWCSFCSKSVKIFPRSTPGIGIKTDEEDLRSGGFQVNLINATQKHGVLSSGQKTLKNASPASKLFVSLLTRHA